MLLGFALIYLGSRNVLPNRSDDPDGLGISSINAGVLFLKREDGDAFRRSA